MAVVNNGGRSLYFAAAGDVQAGRLIVNSIIWSGATTETHTLTLKDSAGNIIWGPIIAGAAGATGSPIAINFAKPQMFNGIEADVMGSGTLNIILA